MSAESLPGERTQFRQLLDLLGSMRGVRPNTGIVTQAYERLAELGRSIPPEEQSKILREPGQRLRNRDLVSVLAHGEAKPAAAAMAIARLTEKEWAELIPQLPIMARGFLRHRRDLSPATRDLLEKYGVRDFALPDAAETLQPALQPSPAPIASPPPVPAATPLATPSIAPRDLSQPSPDQGDSITNLLDRIANYRRGRRPSAIAPRLPLGDSPASELPPQITRIAFVSNAEGIVTEAASEAAPWLVGMSLMRAQPGQLVRFSEGAERRLRHHQPLRDQEVTLDAAPAISGDWRLDALPIFSPHGGAFTGYRGILRRPPQAAERSLDPAQARAEQMRQILHELRTPVGAIQGFAEIIQQQLLAAVPHEYRAHAAAISVDAAKLLAGFDEIDRLARLETGAMALESGHDDFRIALSETVQRLASVLEQRNAGFDLSVSGSPFTTALANEEMLRICWRLLATAAGALSAGERVSLALTGNGTEIELEMELPRRLRSDSMPDSGDDKRRPVVSSGMFGPKFAFRLAAAEISAANGLLTFYEDRLTLTLPSHASSGTDKGTHARQTAG